MEKKIKKYTQLEGIAGNEILVKKELEKVFEKEKIIYDNLGSLAITIKSDNKNAKKIGIFGHMDEVGLMITKIKKDGLIQVINIGGISVDSLICQRVSYKNSSNEKFTGIIMSSSPHVDAKKTKNIEDLEVNFGFKDEKDAKTHGFEVGAYINFVGEFTKLANDSYITKAADNRIGCAVVEKLYDIYGQTDNNFELTLGATVQEEVGLKGAGTLLSKLDKDFDQILIVDVSPIDGMKELKIGSGPLLRLAEPRGVYDVLGNKELKSLSNKLNIKIQDYFSKGRTDGAQMQVSLSGYKVNALCVPAFNLHTNSTMFNLKDVEDIINIIKGFLDEL